MGTTFRTHINAPNGSGSLASAINASVTTLTLNAGHTLTGYTNFTLSIDNEILLCDSVSGVTVTVNASGRGYDGSTAASHSANTYCYNYSIAKDFTSIETAVNTVENLLAADATVSVFANATSLTVGATTGTATWRNATNTFSGATAFNVTAPATFSGTLGVTGATTATQINGRSLYLTNGSELITNGTFDTTTTGWLSSGSTLSINAGTLRVTWTAGNAWAGQCVTGLTVGKRYKLTYQYIGGTAGSSYSVYIGTATSLIGTGYSAYAGVFAPAASLVTYYFVATSTNFSIAFGSYLGSAAYTDWDNISLIEMADVATPGTVFGGHVGAPYLASAVTIPYGTILTSGYGVSYLICSNNSGVPIAMYQDVDTWYLQKSGAAMITTNASGTTIANALTSTGVVAVNSASGITTNQTTFPLVNATATTINFGGAATTLNVGAATCATTLNGFTTTYDSNTSNSITQPLKVQHVGDGNLNQGVSIGLYVSSGAGAEMGRIAAVNDVSAGASMRFYVRASSSIVEKARLYSNGMFAVTQLALFALNTAPSSAADTGTLGEVRWDANYMYVCTATNTWKRAAIATW